MPYDFIAKQVSSKCNCVVLDDQFGRRWDPLFSKSLYVLVIVYIRTDEKSLFNLDDLILMVLFS